MKILFNSLLVAINYHQLINIITIIAGALGFAVLVVLSIDKIYEQKYHAKIPAGYRSMTVALVNLVLILVTLILPNSFLKSIMLLGCFILALVFSVLSFIALHKRNF